MKRSKNVNPSAFEKEPKATVLHLSNSWSWHELVIFLLAFFFYCNTLNNSYALDDVLAITANKYVQMGVKGIPDIISHAEFAGATSNKSSETLGRYRPLSILFYALEWQAFGNSPTAFHFFNVLWYAVLCVVIFRFLKYAVFKNNVLMAFCISVLFAIHPVHTEVVANIKSRDEIFSLLFLLLSLGSLLRYTYSSKKIWLILSLVAFALAAFSKDYALLFALGIPAFLFSFTPLKIKEIFKLSVFFWVVLIFYAFVRVSISSAMGSGELVESVIFPYENYAFTAKAAIIMMSLWKYLLLLFYPHALTYDYSYDVFQFATIAHPIVIVSIVIHFSLLIFGCYRLIKKQGDGIFLLLYLSSLIIISWMLLDYGYVLAERFLFSPSFYFLTAFGLIIDRQVPSRFFSQKIILPLLCVVVGLSFFQVFERNKVWKNNSTLYFEDVKVSSKSVRAQAFCGMTLVAETDTMSDSINKNEALKQAVDYFNNSYKIFPGLHSFYHNWGLAYFRLGKMDSAQWAWSQLKILKPNSKLIAIEDKAINDYYLRFYSDRYNQAKQENDLKKMLDNYSLAINHINKGPQEWLNLGKLYKLNGMPDSAIFSWKQCLLLDSTNKEAKGFLDDLH